MDNMYPGERLDGESSVNYEAFAIYRDMGRERSLNKVSEKLAKSDTLIKRWSAKFDWVKRAAAWDDEQDRISREIAQREQEKEIKNMRKRHSELAKKMLDTAEAALEAFDIDEIKPADVSRMVDIASKLERISRGDVGEVVEERDGGPATPAVQFYLPSNGRDNLSDDPLEE